MGLAFDSLGYAQRLREAGVEREAAEAHATAARDYIMAELATKSDIAALRHEIERASLNVTIRLGALIAVGVGVLAALQRMH